MKCFDESKHTSASGFCRGLCFNRVCLYRDDRLMCEQRYLAFFRKRSLIISNWLLSLIAVLLRALIK